MKICVKLARKLGAKPGKLWKIQENLEKRKTVDTIWRWFVSRRGHDYIQNLQCQDCWQKQFKASQSELHSLHPLIKQVLGHFHLRFIIDKQLVLLFRLSGFPKFDADEPSDRKAQEIFEKVNMYELHCNQLQSRNNDRVPLLRKISKEKS